MHSFSLQKKLIRGKTNLREVKKKKKEARAMAPQKYTKAY